MTAVALHCTERVEDWFVGAVGKGHIRDAATIGDGKRLIAVAVAANAEADNRQAVAMNMMRATTDLRTTAEHLARIGIDVVCRSRSGKLYVRQRARCSNQPYGTDPLEAA